MKTAEMKRKAIIRRINPEYGASRPYSVSVLVLDGIAWSLNQCHFFEDYEKAFEFADFVADGNVDDRQALFA